MSDDDLFLSKAGGKKKAPPIKTTYQGPSKIEFNVSNIDWVTVLKCMDRALSTLRNKTQVQEKKGAYYFDYIKWTAEYKKIQEIAKLDKLMEGK